VCLACSTLTALHALSCHCCSMTLHCSSVGLFSAEQQSQGAGDDVSKEHQAGK